MFKDQLTAFLKIRPEETRMVVLMAGLFLCLQAGQGMGENAAFALFLSSINVDFLPYMYMGLGGVVFIVSIAYSIYPGPNLSRHNPEHKVYPYLLRNVTAAYPNHVWGIDITYIRLRRSWLYLVAVIDWFSRYVVSWELDQTLEMPFVGTTVERALTQASPTIWNSDQGSHFTSPQYTQLLLQAGEQISMDGKGRAS